MNDKTPIDFEAVNAKLNSVSERTRIRQEEEEKRRAEEAARLAEEREDRLSERAAQLRDQFYETFANADITDASSTENTIALFEECMQVLSGERLVSAPASSTTPVSPTPPSVPFDWDSLSENQRSGVQLLADNDIAGKKLKVLETVITASNDRFFVRASDGAVIDGQIKARKTAASSIATGESKGSDAPAPEPEPTPAPAPTPADMPTKKAAVKKTVVAPAQPSESTQPPETAQPSSDGTAETGSLAKKQSFTDRAKAAGKNLVKKLD